MERHQLHVLVISILFFNKSTCNGDIEIIPVSLSIFLSVCSSVTLTLLKPLDEIQPNVSLFHLSVLI